VRAASSLLALVAASFSSLFYLHCSAPLFFSPADFPFCCTVSGSGVTSVLLRPEEEVTVVLNFLTGFRTSYFYDVISSSGLGRHIFVTSFPHRIYDVIFL
jgi:hypothetical protein